MLNIKCLPKAFFACLILLSSFCFSCPNTGEGDCQNTTPPSELKTWDASMQGCPVDKLEAEGKIVKKYISTAALFLKDAQLLIKDGANFLRPSALCQDSQGMYIYIAAAYGYCPNGHPYNIDGGCLGYNCPYN